MRIKTATLEGRKHFVVPVVMAREGVMKGSRGPLFYPGDELERSVPHWDGRPVVIYHPSMQYDHAAGNPEVFDRQRVGTIFNTRYDRKAKTLRAEAWLDADRLARVDRRVYAAVAEGRPTEVSTGLHTDDDGGDGVFNGRQYIAVARNYRPDHLAILPDQKGACSLADGCGLCRHEAAEAEEALIAPATA